MISDSQRERAMQLIAQGELNAAQIAEAVQVSPSTVKKWRAAGQATAPTAKPRDYFAVGQVTAGFEVLELVAEHAHLGQTRYRVRWLCCGEETEMTHKLLQWRATHNAQWCADCARIVGGKTVASLRREAQEQASRPPVLRSPVLHLALSGAWR